MTRYHQDVVDSIISIQAAQKSPVSAPAENGQRGRSSSASGRNYGDYSSAPRESLSASDYMVDGRAVTRRLSAVEKKLDMFLAESQKVISEDHSGRRERVDTALDILGALASQRGVDREDADALQKVIELLNGPK